MNESFNRVLLNKGTAATMIKKKKKKTCNSWLKPAITYPRSQTRCQIYSN